jgi:hypothetical protein
MKRRSAITIGLPFSCLLSHCLERGRWQPTRGLLTS